MLWRYYTFTFLVNLHFFSAVLVPFFTDWGHLTLSQVMFLQSWFMFWIFVLEVPTGAVADYIGRKYSLALGALVVTFGALIYGSFPRFESFLLGEFLFALMVALISGADEAFLYDTLKRQGKEDQSKKYFGRARSFELGGMLISAPIGSLLAARFGLNVPMLAVIIPSILAVIVALTLKEPQAKKKVLESRRYLEIIKVGFFYFLKHSYLRLLAIDAVIVATSAYFIIWLYQPLLRSLGVAVVYFGFIHAALIIAEILISSNFARWEKVFGSEKNLVRGAALITGLSFAAAALFPNIFTAMIFVVVGGGFGLTRLTLMSSYMNRLIPSEQRATVLSSISMFRRLALVVVNPLVGMLADRSLSLSLLLIGILPLAVFLFSPVRKSFKGT